MPRGGRHVHVLIAMMQQVHLPEDLAAMVEAVLPVLQKVPDETSDQHGEQAAAHALEAQRGQIDHAEADGLNGPGEPRRNDGHERAHDEDVDEAVAKIERVVAAWIGCAGKKYSTAPMIRNIPTISTNSSPSTISNNHAGNDVTSVFRVVCLKRPCGEPLPHSPTR